MWLMNADINGATWYVFHDDRLFFSNLSALFNHKTIDYVNRCLKICSLHQQNEVFLIWSSYSSHFRAFVAAMLAISCFHLFGETLQ